MDISALRPFTTRLSLNSHDLRGSDRRKHCARAGAPCPLIERSNLHGGSVDTASFCRAGHFPSRPWASSSRPILIPHGISTLFWYSGSKEASLLLIFVHCLPATLLDAVFITALYLAGWLLSGEPLWIVQLTFKRHLTLFLIGIAAAIAVELCALHHGWCGHNAAYPPAAHWAPADLATGSSLKCHFCLGARRFVKSRCRKCLDTIRGYRAQTEKSGPHPLRLKRKGTGPPGPAFMSVSCTLRSLRRRKPATNMEKGDPR